jgi:hypothetical protein
MPPSRFKHLDIASFALSGKKSFVLSNLVQVETPHIWNEPNPIIHLPTSFETIWMLVVPVFQRIALKSEIQLVVIFLTTPSVLKYKMF